MHDTLHARNFSNYDMKKSTFTIALLLSITSIKAQDISEVKLLPQNDLRKWGVKAGNYSGIANLNPEKSAGEMLSFAIVNDKEKQEGFYILDIKQNAKTGEIELVKQSKLLSGNKQTSPHSDAEGIAYAPNTNTHLYLTKAVKASLNTTYKERLRERSYKCLWHLTVITYTATTDSNL